MESKFESFLIEGEEIMWEGQCKLLSFKKGENRFVKVMSYVFYFILLEKEALAIPIIPVFIMGLIFSKFHLTVQVITIVLAFLWFINMIVRLKKSRFSISNKRIYIQIWNIGGPMNYIIPFETISQVNLELFSNGSGMIHILPKRLLDLKALH